MTAHHIDPAPSHVDAEARRVVGTGSAEGSILASDLPLSLWGGVDPARGRVIDRHHPLCGESWDDRVLVVPHGRGSCTGSAVLLEAIHAAHAPAMILLNRPDAIIGLGAIVAEEVLQRAMPVVVLDDATFAMALQAEHACLQVDGVLALQQGETSYSVRVATAEHAAVELLADDQRRLAGDGGRAAQVAMRIVQRMAQLQGASVLVGITRVHIDGCIYTGPAGLAFARQLVDWQGRFAVPTTLNAISIDRRRWRDLGVPESQARPAASLAEAYVQLGARPTYTCAPYLLDDVPGAGETIAWAESNAVVFANSVLGARTDKTPDLLDACIALTGRAPLSGYYLDDERRARVVVQVPPIAAADDALYPLLGYVVGSRADADVPVVTGLAPDLTRDALKAFGAAFATTSSAGMFHIVGVTPEADTLDAALAGHAPKRQVRLTLEDLRTAWAEFNVDRAQEVGLVALGNPHFSCEEFAALAALCAGRRRHDAVDVVVTTSRHVADQAEHAGFLATLNHFGIRLITDTCWCMLREPVVVPSTRAIVTNSAKYAHYGPGLIGQQQIRFTSLSGCVEAAVTGHVSGTTPAWLSAAEAGH